ncbi:amino acid adenylation domain-containing protein [Spizellomyces punctatus DAOM BR117]|uniref:Amino acid adenylation domain-containing protein n=1 Tax=Spizellomyces punctatus (strain DAOM BR117) TaxID=645134 RepID=A0A0L0HBB3_SPIPD|nr:amino acid adenylation domain-containing protein [Spizellomyces punctatus DAOM BR117]KNC98875.1 amino acid adenylation domain-containing protein [Spizellomyces punctatus DAOM BR117]|eukprot:XP_016606915.1 amino acid adenylation domain-containing protein [Spizellomyces punctatus DAOM BR117]
MSSQTQQAINYRSPRILTQIGWTTTKALRLACINAYGDEGDVVASIAHVAWKIFVGKIPKTAAYRHLIANAQQELENNAQGECTAYGECAADANGRPLQAAFRVLQQNSTDEPIPNVQTHIVLEMLLNEDTFEFRAILHSEEISDEAGITVLRELTNIMREIIDIPEAAVRLPANSTDSDLTASLFPNLTGKIHHRGHTVSLDAVSHTSFIIKDLDGHLRALETTPETLGKAAWAKLLTHYTGENEAEFGLLRGDNDCIVPVQLSLDEIDNNVALLQKLMEQEQVARIDLIDRRCETLLQYGRTPTAIKSHGTILHLIMHPTDEIDQFKLTVHYNEKLLPRRQAMLLLQQFEHVYRGILENPSAPPLELADTFTEDLLSITIATNPNVNTESAPFLHSFFAATALRCPSNVALEFITSMSPFSIQSWTYASLEKESNKLANLLITAYNVQPDDIIPICMEKSAFMYISILGVLKAGCAYCPIDWQTPVERAQYILEETKAHVILISGDGRKLASHPQFPSDVVVLQLDDSASPFHTSPETTPPVPALLTHHLAYVLYTSGTTGRPKGVMISHDSATRSIQSHCAMVPCRKTSKFLQFAATTFDVSIFDMFFTWRNGITLVAAKTELMHRDLSGVVRSGGITHLDLTPTVAGTLRKQDVPGLEVLFCIGEALTQKVVDEFGSANGTDCTLLNAYGPTEAAISCTIANVKKDAGTLPANIGTPFPTCSIYVIARGSLYPVPIGCIGELCLAGTQLARGYLARPDLTTDKFLTFPYNGERIYRTGDLVRQLSDGTIEYLGRIDDQVKLNGYRIELAEVNSALMQANNGVQQAVTMVLRHPSWIRDQMVVFLSLIGEKRPGEACEFLKTFGRESTLSNAVSLAKNLLAPYMVPNIFLLVSKIPLGTAGKVDRKCLKQMFLSLSAEALQDMLGGHTSEVGVNEKWTAEQHFLRQIIAETAAVPLHTVEKDTTIFHVGIDSIGAMRFVARLREERGIEMSIIDVMQNPTVALMTQFIDNRELSCAKVQPPAANESHVLEAFASRVQEIVFSQLKGVVPDAVKGIYPCTPLQDGLLYGTQKTPGAYFTHETFTLHPSVDLETLQRAWMAVIDNNDILRTSFCHVGDSTATFAQIVHHSVKMRWTSRIVQSKELIAKVQKDHISTFGSSVFTAQDVPMSFVLFECGDIRSLVLSIHHALFDGWSLPLILQDVQTAYSSCGSDLPKRPPFSRMIPHLLGDKQPANSRNFWTDALSNVRPVAFPGLSQTTVFTPGSHTVTRKVSTSLTEVERLCRQAGTSIRAVGQATWSILLSAYLDTPDVTFGHVVSGRTLDVPGVAQVIGPCLNTVPCRLRIDQYNSIHELLQDIQRQYVNMLPYQHTPLRSIQKWSGMANGLFDTIFVLQKTDNGGHGYEDEIWNWVDTVDEDEYAISIEVEPIATNDTVVLKAICKNALCSQSQSELLVAEFEAIMLGILQHPSSNPNLLHQLNLPGSVLSISPMAHLPETSRTGALFMHSFVENQANTNPTAVAVNFVSEITKSGEALGEEYTYQALDREANRFANLLLAKGLTLGAEVSLCAPKSLSWFAALLGISKAGGVYVPIDHEAPVDRKRYILNDVGSKYVVTISSLEVELKKVVPLDTEFIILNDDQTRAHLFAQSDLSPSVELTPSDLAYILYTSGTTGRPKGVLVEHANVTHSIEAHRHLIKWHPAARFLQFASCSFDVSIYEMLFPWSAGMCVCAADKDLLLKDLELAFRAMHITHAELTPSVASMVKRQNVPQLEVLLTGGEALTQNVLEEWADGEMLYNAYGPTEATIGCTMLCGVQKSAKVSNIGRPFPNVFACVLPVHGERHPVLKGATGELCVGGPLVTRGYLGQPELTAAKFINWSPVSSPTSIERLYRTGDHVRLMADGTLEFLGRVDDQVKINGIRIELGEINSRLRAASKNVINSVTTLIGRSGAFKSELVAFLVMDTAFSKECEIILSNEKFREIRENIVPVLKRELPLYMVPSFILPITALPLGTTGKVDINRLSALFQNLSPEALHSCQAPDDISANESWTDLEKVIRDAIVNQREITVHLVSRTSTIFELGLDSLSAISLSASLRKKGLELSVSDIMQHPTILEMAKYLEARVDTGGRESIELSSSLDVFATYEEQSRKLAAENPSLAGNIECAYPCLPLQEGMVAECMKSGGALNINEITLDLEPWVEFETLRHAWLQLQEQTDILRTAFFAMSDGSYGQAVLGSNSGFIASFETKSYASQPSLSILLEQQRNQVVQDMYNMKPPVSAWVLQNENSTNTRLSIIIHHALYDGWSLPLLLNDFKRLYHGQCAPRRPLFREFVRYVENIGHTQEEVYWRRILHGATSCQFPDLSGRRKDTDGSPHSCEASRHLSATRSELETAARAIGVTVQVLVQAAWAKLLSYYVGEPDVTFGHVISGRTAPVSGVEQIAGPCFNTIPCRVNLSDRKLTNRQLLQSIQTHNSTAISHQHASLRLINRWIGASTEQPLFNTILIYQKTEGCSAEDNLSQLWKEEKDGQVEIDYPVSVEVEPLANNRLALRILCRSDVVPEEHANLLARQLESVLLDLTLRPDGVAADIPFDEQEVVSISNPTPTVVSGLLHGAVEKYAEESPKKIALEWAMSISDTTIDMETWTYATLNEQANKIAHLLLSKVQSCAVVPICLDKSPLSYMAILGVLKAGCAYVPLDPALPLDRRLFIVKDTKAPAVLTTSQYAAALQGGKAMDSSFDIISLDSVDLQGQSARNPRVATNPSDLAYILYTSGTTGLPKGVMVEHGSATACLHSFQSMLPWRPVSRFLQFSSFSFDVSISETFMPWLGGHTVCTASKDTLLIDLEQAIRMLKITHADLTPTLITLLHRDRVPDLRVLITGGEMIPQKILDEWAGLNDISLYNAYGPTETTINCAVNRQVKRSAKPANIGQPQSSCSIYILSQSLQCIPIGGIGELCVGGIQVARGYLNLPKLTQDKFCTFLNPLSGKEERVYRTGDLARMLHDGSIEFIGRLDDQVKLNGLRIELEEVNAVLSGSDPNISNVATLVLRRREQQNHQLVSFIALGNESGDCKIIKGDLHAKVLENATDAAARKLPAYMVPTHILLINTLPLGKTDKVDRKVLATLYTDIPSEVLDSWGSQNGADGIWSDEESHIRDALGEIANVPSDTISRHSSVFQLGLDSISVIRLASLLRKHDITLTVSEIMGNPSIARMSHHLKHRQNGMESRRHNIAQARNMIANFEKQIKPALLARSTQEQSDAIISVYPCTPLQEGMLAGTSKSDGLYINHFVFELEEHTDSERLLEAWRKVIEQNDIFRTSFHLTNDETFVYAQVVNEKVWMPVKNIQIQHGGDFPAAFDEHTKCSTATIGDFRRPPLGFALVRSPSQAWLIVSIHHALFDGWSFSLTLTDVQAHYRGVPPPLRPQFRSFVESTVGQVEDKSKLFWQERLARANISEFPDNLHGKTFKTHEASAPQLVEIFSEISYGEVATRCREMEVSVQSVGQAAWALLLAAYLGQKDVIFGHIVSGRSIPGSAAVIGPTLNTIPCRVQVDKHASNLDLVRHVHQFNIEAIPYYHTSLRAIMNALGRNKDAKPLFDTIFLFQQSHQEVHTDETTLWKEIAGQADVDYAVSIELEPNDDVLVLRAACRPSLMPEDQLNLLLRQLDMILRHIIQEPHGKIGDFKTPALDLMSIQPRKIPDSLVQKKRRSWFCPRNFKTNHTIDTMHQFIEKHAAASPHRICLEFASSISKSEIHSWTYREFNSKANKLARFLRNCGVTRNMLVPICLKQSPWMYLAIIAVLKAGAGYVPVDPQAPAKRKTYIFSDVDASFVLTSPDIADIMEELEDGTPRQYICVDDSIEGRLKTLSSSNLPNKVTRNDLAYVIYTSGTTGLPKGVMIEHGSAVVAIESFQRLIPADQHARFLQFASFTFDVSIFEMFFAWSMGLTLVTAPRDVLLADLELAMRVLNVTHADLTPTVATLIRRSAVPSIELLVTGGEALSQQVLDDWAGTLYNAYGPTEATIGCVLRPSVSAEIRPTNIGHVFDSCSAFVLSEDLNVIPRGGVGELCIGGPQVARGYLKRPDLTAERFVYLPLAKERIYKTGDFVRMLADGSIEFLGRQDDQVKLNGLRIELGEINSVMCKAHPDIKDVVTLVLKHPQLQREQLVAFVVLKSDYRTAVEPKIIGSLATSTILKEALKAARRALPLYMVPAHVFLTSLIPLGNTGKADRKALSYLFYDLDANSLQAMQVPDIDRPWSELAREIRRCLAQVARVPVEMIGQDSSVFQLGLDSISAIRLSSELKKSGLNIGVSEIMRCSTIALMESHVQDSRDKHHEDVQLKRDREAFLNKFVERHQRGLDVDLNDVVAIYPCTPLQEAMLVETLKSTKRPYINHIPFDLHPSVDVKQLVDAWQAVVAANDILRTSFHPVEDDRYGYAQVVQRGSTVHFMERHLEHDEDLQTVIKEQTDVIFKNVRDLRRPPLGFALLQGPIGTCLLLSIHHALYDGWSLPLILQDVRRKYKGEPLSDRPQFVTLVKSILTESEEDSKRHWLALLDDCHPSIFPTTLYGTHAPSESDVSFFASRVCGVDATDISKICQSLGVSMQAVGQAAWGLLLAAYLGEDDVVFGHVVSGRSVQVDDVGDVIGPAFNTIPTRVKLAQCRTYADLLRAIHAANVSGVPFQHTPLRSIARWTSQSAYGWSLFDTIFLFQKTEDSSESGEPLWDIAEGHAEVNHAVSIEMEPTGKILHLRASCQAKVMPHAHLTMLLEQLERIIKRIISCPEESVRSYGMKSTSHLASVHEQKRKVKTSSITTLHGFLEHNASRLPTHPALEFSAPVLADNCDTTIFTYAELNRKSNQLAHYFISRGVTANTFLPICLEKGIWMYLSLLAVLKTGAAYVPTAPEIPPERKEYIFKDVNAQFVVATEPVSTEITCGNPDATVLVVDDRMTEILREFPDTNPAVPVSISDPAYVIYTSGTTGVPKGVAIQHDSAVEAFTSFQELIPWNATSRFLQFASFTFDVSIFEMFFAWSTGITLVSAPKDYLLADLEQAMKKLRVTHADLTPTVATMIRPDNVALDILVTGGEALTQQVLDDWAGKGVLYNAYGPTEATIGCTMRKVDSNTSPLNIGMPFNSCSAYVLNGPEILPRGAIGELCIGGPQVAMEYINNPSLTSEKFAILPATNERIYRTGDYVRMLAEGSIQFLGRQDEQVKMNGLRIELAEISSVLAKADAASICDVVTMVLKHPAQERDQLVAFVSLLPGRDETESLLAEECKIIGSAFESPVLKTAMEIAARKLPIYMVPGLIFLVNKIPLGNTGKADRKKLAQIYQGLDITYLRSAGANEESDDNWTQTEKVIRQCLSEVSGAPLQSITRHNTSIFQLGLDSISSVKLSSKLKSHGIVLPVPDIMKFPTVARLSSRLSEFNADLEKEKVEMAQAAKREKILVDFDAKFTPVVLEESGLEDGAVAAVYPCSPLQEGMIVETLKSEGRHYLNHAIFELKSAVDVQRLLNAWESVIRANDILRTGFYSVDSPLCGYAQVVLLKSKMQLTVEYLSRNDQLRPACERHIQNVTRSMLDLRQPPIACAVLHAPQQKWLVVTLHHALYDGWSLPLILDDVRKAYMDLELTRVRPQFKELLKYILMDSRVDAQEHWSNVLTGFTPTVFPDTLLGTAYISGTSKTSTHFESRITELKVEEVAAACQTLNVSMQSFGQAAWGLLLAAYTGEADVIFGRVISGRSIPLDGANDVIGPSFNTIPCRVQTENVSNAQLVTAVHKANIDAIPYQHTPLSWILKSTEKNRDGLPLFGTLFLFQVGSGENEDDDHPLWTTIGGEAEVNYDVTLEIEPTGPNFAVRATCKTSIMPTSHLSTLLLQFEHILTNLIRNPDRRLLPLDDPLPDRMMSIIPRTRDANVGGMLTDQPLYLHTWVEHNAQSQPDAMALQFARSTSLTQYPEIETITYDMLNRKSNRIAHFLISRGIRPETFVPLSMDRSPWMYICILGVLKAGAAYVPMDPDAPPERKRFMLSDVGAKIVLTTASDAMNLRTCCPDEIEVICVDELDDLISTYPQTNPHVEEFPQSTLAYLIYTSGTTGTPKGVMIEHHSVVEAILSFQELIPISGTAQARFLQFASYTFDVSVFEMFYTWSMGMVVVSAPKDVLLTDLENAIQILGATHADLTPTVAAMVRPENVPSLKVLVTGGESLTQHVVDAWTGDGVTLINAYGPTEATIGCTMFVGVESTTQRNNIGQVWPSCSAYVVSTSHDLLPRGAVGELCVGGPQVARGYLNRPDLTSSKFIQLPAGGERVYCTGDIVRLLPDGCVQFLGRRDDQVKLNGLRIELGEINAVITKSDPSITDTVTMVVKHPKQVRDQIVSFIGCDRDVRQIQIDKFENMLLKDDDGTSTKLISAALHAARRHLPAYMVPSLIVPLTGLPRGATNKVNSSALARMFKNLDFKLVASLTKQMEDSDGGISGDLAETTWTDLESAIRNVLAEVSSLSLDEITLRASIYHLGLDSISAIRVSSKLRGLGIHISVGEILRQKTIKNIADFLTERDRLPEYKHQPGATRLMARELVKNWIGEDFLSIDLPNRLSTSMPAVAGVYPATAGQIFTLSSWHMSQGRYFMPSFIFTSRDAIDVRQLEEAWIALLKRHEILRTGFLSTSSQTAPFVQIVFADPVVNWSCEAFDIPLEENIVKERVEYEKMQPAVVSSPPVRLHCMAFQDRAALVLTIHHALYDGWSIPLLLSDLSTLYRKQPLAEHSVRWSDYLEYAFETRQSMDNSPQQEYWRKMLDETGTAFFPHLNASSPNSTDTALYVPVAIPNAAKYTSACQRKGITLHSLFLAAWGQLQAKYTNANHALFGLYHSGRSIGISDVDTLRGPCVNVLPFQVRNARTLSVLDCAKNAQDELAMQNEAVPCVSMHDVQVWSGYPGQPIVNVFVNFLMFPNGGNDGDDAKVELFKACRMRDWETQNAPIPASHKTGLDGCLAAPLQNDIDLEVAVHNDVISLGLYCPSHVMSMDQAGSVVKQLCDSVINALD